MSFSPLAMAGGICSSRWNRISLGMLPRQLFLELGTIVLLHAIDYVLSFIHLPFNLFAVVPVIRKARMDISERQLGELRGDFIGRLALKLVPDVDVVNANPSATIQGFPPQTLGLLSICLMSLGSMSRL